LPTGFPRSCSWTGWCSIPLRRSSTPLQALQAPDRWQQTRDQLFALWLTGAPARVEDQIRREMGGYGFEMWARAGREIAAAYSRHGSLLHMLSSLPPSDESTGCGVAFELALSGRIRLSRQQSRSRIEGRHVRPRRHALGGEQGVKLGGTPAEAPREPAPRRVGDECGAAIRR
jgi:hypothetical protein